MTEVIEDVSSAAVVSALETNMCEFYATWGRAPARELYEGSDLVRVSTGIPIANFNGIFRAQLTSATIETTIATTVAYLASRQVPTYWWVGPLARPSDIGTHLERHGFVHVRDVSGMAVQLPALSRTQHAPADLAIKVVEDLETLREWARIAWVGSGFPESSQDAFIDLELSLGLAQRTSRCRYIAYQSGSPVATSAMLLHAGLAGIFAVATLPEARRQGIGAAVTLAPLRDAYEIGYRVGVLQSSKVAIPLYQQLGFQDICEFGLYRWER